MEQYLVYNFIMPSFMLPRLFRETGDCEYDLDFISSILSLLYIIQYILFILLLRSLLLSSVDSDQLSLKSMNPLFTKFPPQPWPFSSSP